VYLRTKGRLQVRFAHDFWEWDISGKVIPIVRGTKKTQSPSISYCHHKIIHNI